MAKQPVGKTAEGGAHRQEPVLPTPQPESERHAPNGERTSWGREGTVSDPDFRHPSEAPWGDARGAPGWQAATRLVREAMTRDVEVLHPDNTLEQAAEAMQRFDVGPLPVCDGNRLVGLITDRDIIVRSVAQGGDPARGRVRDVMTPEVFCCFEDQDVAEAARLMQAKQVRQLPVLDRDGRLVGIVSLRDLGLTWGKPG